MVLGECHCLPETAASTKILWTKRGLMNSRPLTCAKGDSLGHLCGVVIPAKMAEAYGALGFVTTTLSQKRRRRHFSSPA